MRIYFSSFCCLMALSCAERKTDSPTYSPPAQAQLSSQPKSSTSPVRIKMPFAKKRTVLAPSASVSAGPYAQVESALMGTWKFAHFDENHVVTKTRLEGMTSQVKRNALYDAEQTHIVFREGKMIWLRDDKELKALKYEFFADEHAEGHPIRMKLSDGQVIAVDTHQPGKLRLEEVEKKEMLSAWYTRSR